MLAERFDPVELPILGGYDNSEQHEMVAAAAIGDQEKDLAQALREYGFNARYPHPDGQVEWGSELLRIYDPDVEA